MIINFCGFRRRVRPNGSSSEKENANGATKASTINNLMKPRSLWDAVKVNKRAAEKKQLQQEMKSIITLQDLIVSSPCDFNKSDDQCMKMAETPMHKQSSSSKIHPSFDEGDVNLDLKQTLILPEECGGVSSLSRSRSKKKVSFRSPEVADVFVLPPEKHG